MARNYDTRSQSFCKHGCDTIYIWSNILIYETQEDERRRSEAGKKMQLLR